MLQKEIKKRLVDIEGKLEILFNLQSIKNEIMDKAKESIDKEKEQEKMVEDMAKEHEKKKVVFTEGAKEDFKKIPEKEQKEIMTEINKLAKGEIEGEPVDLEKMEKEEPEVYKQVTDRFKEIKPENIDLANGKYKTVTQNYGKGTEGPIKEDILIKQETKNIKEYETKCYTCSNKIKIPEEPQPNTVYRCKKCLGI